jgi:hypothetical protein
MINIIALSAKMRAKLNIIYGLCKDFGEKSSIAGLFLCFLDKQSSFNGQSSQTSQSLLLCLRNVLMTLKIATPAAIATIIYTRIFCTI